MIVWSRFLPEQFFLYFTATALFIRGTYSSSVSLYLVNKDKGKGQYSYSWGGTPPKSYGTSLPYGITQCYLPPETSEHAPPNPRLTQVVLNLPTLEGWKAELT